MSNVANNLNMVGEKTQILFGNDTKVIEKHISDLAGGRVLDVTGFEGDTIYAGHVVISNGTIYKPMPIASSGTAYDALPSGYNYVGVVYRSVSTKKPQVSILTNGEVNSELVPFPMTTIMTAFKAACPMIVFVKDEAVNVNA